MTFDGWNMGWAWVWMVGGTILTVVVVVAVVWALTSALQRRDGQGGARGPGTDTALEILRERYARGEISQAEFEQGVRTLKETQR